MAPRAHTVVIVDDEDGIRELLKASLELDDRFEVVGEGANGQEGVAACGKLQPDIVVLDLMMPVMGGLDAIPEIKRVSPETQIVILSALSGHEPEGKALKQGAAFYLEKARSISDLAMWLSTVVALKDGEG